MNNRLQSAITLHDTLHGFIHRRGMGMATMEANLAQQLAGMVHELLFQFLLDVRKTYN